MIFLPNFILKLAFLGWALILCGNSTYTWLPACLTHRIDISFCVFDQCVDIMFNIQLHYIALVILIPLVPMGILAPRLRTFDVSARPPIDTSINLTARVSAVSHLNISPNLLEVISEVLEP
jgi:hypothetical protein